MAKSKIKKDSIETKVEAIVLIIMIVAFSAVSVFNLTYMYQKLMAEEKEQLQLQADRCATDINSWIAEESANIEGVASMVEALGQTNVITLKAIIKQTYRNNPELLNVYIGLKSGRCVVANQNAIIPDNFDPREQNWYQLASVSKETIVIPPYFDETTNNMCISVATPIYMLGMFVGVAGADITLDAVTDFTCSVNNYEEGAYGVLIDSDGNWVCSLNEEVLPTQEKTYSVKETTPALEDLYNIPGTIVKLKDFRGKMVYYSAATVEKCNWTLGIAVPVSNVSSTIIKALLISFIIEILLMLAAIFVIRYFIRKMLNPVEEMLPAIDKLSQGNLESLIHFTTQEDELGSLQNSLSMLVGVINDIIKQEQYILTQMSMGNLNVEDMDALPGDFNEISVSVNSIKRTLNEIIRDIQYSAINLQSTAMGFTGATNPEEINALVEELSAQANEMMDKANMFRCEDKSKE